MQICFLLFILHLDITVSQFQHVTKQAKNYFIMFIYLFYRESLPHYIFQDMLGILARLSHQTYLFLQGERKAPDKALQLVEIATECFRTLRNSCAGCKTNQEEVLK